MNVWVVTETNCSCDLYGNEEKTKEVIKVFDCEGKAKDYCIEQKEKTKQYYGIWYYDYEQFEVNL